MPTKAAARVLLVGQGPTTATAYESLVTKFDVVGLIRSGDQEDIVRVATDSATAVVTDISLRAVSRAVADLDPDAVVVSSYDRILPADLVRARPFVNVHYAPLPRYRGRATVNWAIINGESHAAISIHSLVPGLDAGGILYQQRVPIGDRDTVTDLYARLNDIQRDVLADAVLRRLGGDSGTPQDESQATYTCTRVPSDGEIDWARSAGQVDRLVRALTAPFPGAFTWMGARRLVVWRAEPVTNAPTYEGRVPGRVVRVDRAAGWVDILTGDGMMRVHEVGLEDGTRVAPATVLTSVRDTVGLSATRLLNPPTRPMLAPATIRLPT